MRILLVSHGFPPHGVAGVERVAHQSATSLAARGHEVTVLTRRPSPAPATLALEREQVDGVDVVRIAGGGSTFAVYPGYEDELERVFELMLAEVLPDVVVLAHLMHHSPGYVAVAHRWAIPVVLELHDFFAACPLAHLQRVSGERCAGPDGGRACAAHCFSGQDAAEARWALRALEFRQAVHDADAVLAPSRFVAEYFGDLRDEHDATPIHVLGNGVGLPGIGGPATAAGDQQGDDGILELASVGVVIEHKGPHVVVEALRRARIGPVRYTLFGQVVRDYAEALREAAADVPGLELRLYGAFRPAELPGLLESADLAIVPSIVWETYSIAAREALACGVPVIASRLGALPEGVRDRENGRLFEAGDASGLAAILHELAGDRSEIDALAAGIRPSDWMTVDDRTDALEGLLEDLVAAGAGPSGPARELAAIRSAL
jgi:glycosyltransferase involved in cell wall biosynthesis